MAGGADQDRMGTTGLSGEKEERGTTSAAQI